ncbi:meiotic recombination protein REC114-like [Uloborus diversus]|uniref:meiotic recombination protein REC114-like n=1 Tax=Uloborus diversus TaxID=327109 RepID=UPI00240A0D65|nr:meiotic recombination protein REC114-like [Uloborus diversus]
MASVKHRYLLKKYAKFLQDHDLKDIEDETDDGANAVHCRGEWKLYYGDKNDLILYYLESDHFLLTEKDTILESFSVINSKSWLKGIAKEDIILISCKLQDDCVRRFQIQFQNDNDKSGTECRREFTKLVKTHFYIIDRDQESEEEESKFNEIVEINGKILDNIELRKGYSTAIDNENLKDVITLCLTDNTFPSYVAEIVGVLKDMNEAKE